MKSLENRKQVIFNLIVHRSHACRRRQFYPVLFFKVLFSIISRNKMQRAVISSKVKTESCLDCVSYKISRSWWSFKCEIQFPLITLKFQTAFPFLLFLWAKCNKILWENGFPTEIFQKFFPRKLFFEPVLCISNGNIPLEFDFYSWVGIKMSILNIHWQASSWNYWGFYKNIFPDLTDK